MYNPSDKLQNIPKSLCKMYLLIWLNIGISQGYAVVRHLYLYY